MGGEGKRRKKWREGDLGKDFEEGREGKERKRFKVRKVNISNPLGKCRRRGYVGRDG